MANLMATGHEAFIIPARTLQGSKQDMLDDLDQAIVGLLALRHLIDDKAPPPDRLASVGAPNGRRRSFWSRMLAAVLPASV